MAWRDPKTGRSVRFFDPRRKPVQESCDWGCSCRVCQRRKRAIIALCAELDIEIDWSFDDETASTFE